MRELLREKERRFKTHLSGEKNLEYFVGRVLAGLAMWPEELRVGSRGRGPQPQLPVTEPGLSPEPGSGPQTPVPQPLASIKTILVSRDSGDWRLLIRPCPPAFGLLTTDPGCHDVLVTTANPRSRGQTRHWPPDDVVLPPVQVNRRSTFLKGFF